MVLSRSRALATSEPVLTCALEPKITPAGLMSITRPLALRLPWISLAVGLGPVTRLTSRLCAFGCAMVTRAALPMEKLDHSIRPRLLALCVCVMARELPAGVPTVALMTAPPGRSTGSVLAATCACTEGAPRASSAHSARGECLNEEGVRMAVLM